MAAAGRTGAAGEIGRRQPSALDERRRYRLEPVKAPTITGSGFTDAGLAFGCIDPARFAR